MSSRVSRVALLVLLALLVPMQPSHALGSKKKSAPAAASKQTPPETALKNYVARERVQQAAEVGTPGSIWSSEGRLVRLGTDAKAVRLHDVVSIVVSESLAATTGGQVKN